MATVRELITKIGFNLDESGIIRAARLIDQFKFSAVGVGIAIAGIATGLVTMAISAAHAGDEILKTAERTGLTVREVQRLQYAAKIADISAEEFTLSMKFLNRALAAAKGGSEEAVEAFRKVGVDPRRAELSEALLERMADGFQSVKSQAEKVGLTLRFFGRSGERWLTVLKDGGVGIRDLGDTLEMFGLLTEDQIKALAEFDNEMKGLRGQMALLKNIIGAALVPGLKKLVEQFQKWLAANREKVIEAILAAANSLATIFVFLVEVVKLLSFGFDELTKAVGSSRAALWTLVAVGIALGLAFGWIDIIVLGVFALIAVFLLLFDDLKRFQSGRKSHFNWAPAIKAATWAIDLFHKSMQLVYPLLEKILEISGFIGEGFIDAASSLGKLMGMDKSAISSGGGGIISASPGAVARMSSAPLLMSKQGSTNMTMSQKVEVNVTGNADPKEIADEVTKKTADFFSRELRQADLNFTPVNLAPQGG